MSRIQSFPPIAEPDARVLILGSMPGAASLRAGEYYAHPRNHFWPLLGTLAGFAPTLPYAARVQALKAAGIAVWDVLHSCKREGSLDVMIERDSALANDFASFFARHTAVTQVYFNGSAAEQIYRRAVLPRLNLPQLAYSRLPSTSPANASYSFARKLDAWQAMSAHLLQPAASHLSTTL